MQLNILLVALIATLSTAAPAAISPINRMVVRSPIMGGTSNVEAGEFRRETLTEVVARHPEADATLAGEGFFKREPIKGGTSNTGLGGFRREALKGGGSNTGPGGFRREALKGGVSNTGPGGF